MVDRNGKVCEYDGYEIPEPMPDTPRRRLMHKQAVLEGLRLAKEIQKKYGIKPKRDQEKEIIGERSRKCWKPWIND